MGFLGILTGKSKLAKPAPDRLFAISTAYVTMETGLGITTRGGAAIVFQPLATADFDAIVRDMEEVVRATASDSGMTVDQLGRQLRLSLAGAARQRLRRSGRRDQRGQHRARGRRLR